MKDLIRNLIKPSYAKRTIFFLLFDVFSIIVSLYLSFQLRFDFNPTPVELWQFLISIPIFLAIKISSFVFFKVYKVIWRFVGLRDLLKILKANLTSTAILIFIIHFLQPTFLSGYPRSVAVIDFAIFTILTGGIRISKRVYLEAFTRRKKQTFSPKLTLILGASSTGEAIARTILKSSPQEYELMGFVDNDKSKIGTYIHDVAVLGGLSDLQKLIQRLDIEALIIAIPSLPARELREIYTLAKTSGIGEVKIVPEISEFVPSVIDVKSIEDLKIEDLIGRKEIKINQEEIRSVFMGKCILITGAGGSIGSEIVKQICYFEPSKIILLDIDETELYSLYLRLCDTLPEIKENLFLEVGDIRDVRRMSEIFKSYKPEIVFHSAAYKHVPVMELHPEEAIKTNVFGTYNLCISAVENKVKKFVFISTDKAVHPVGIMGASKRLGEYVCEAFDKLGDSEFVVVRFGNVLGSRGSVLSLFLDQIKKGGPVTVTHPEMKRFFMTIPEAVMLVLQASAMGRNGDILIVDMGEPVSILKLAEELIQIHGTVPYEDIQIEITGIRAGEKIVEDLIYDEEEVNRTKHEKILKAKPRDSYALSEIKSMKEEFNDKISDSTSKGSRKEAINLLLKKYVKTFSPNRP